MKSVIVGYGGAGQLHRTFYPKDVYVTGVVEILPEKAALAADAAKAERNRKTASEHGLTVYDSVAQAANSFPDFFDICTPKESHPSILEEIIVLGGEFNAIVEKPVCDIGQIDSFTDTVKRFSGKLAVNENYKSSAVTKKIVELMNKHNIRFPDYVEVEFSKNRVQDVEKGRYIYEDLGAFGIEGDHMITVVAGLGKGYLPKSAEGASISDMVLSNGTRLPNQGTAKAAYLTQNGALVFFFTSMTGEVCTQIEPFNPQTSIPADDTSTRYRILAVSDVIRRIFIAGQYEPIAGLNRGEGRVYVMQDGVVVEKYEPIQDSTMGNHLAAIVDFFKGNRRNPSPVDESISVVKALYELRAKADY